MKRLAALGLIRGEGELPTRLLEACHDERLVGGLSLSLRATPDEVVGPLTHAMGGAATKVRVLDVRSGPPMALELGFGGGVTETWTVEDVDALIEQLGDFFRDDDAVKPLVVLGEWEGMLQVWALRADLLEVLLSTQLLDGARNLEALREDYG